MQVQLVLYSLAGIHSRTFFAVSGGCDGGIDRHQQKGIEPGHFLTCMVMINAAQNAFVNRI